MTLELWPAPAPTPFLSTPVTNPNVDRTSSPPAGGRRSFRIPPRRRRASAMAPSEELRRRHLRATTKSGIIAAVHAVVEGLEAPPFPLSLEARTWLTGLLVKRCRAHAGIEAEICPGLESDPPCRATVRGGDLVVCDHRCPGAPACPGSMGRLIACEHATLYEERSCGTWYAVPISCHVPGCPDCEPQRQAKHALRYEAIVALEEPRDIILAVFTAQNARAGELAPELRRHARNLAKLRRTPVFTGRGASLARTADGGPFHPCAHPEHRWRCRLEARCALELAHPSRGRRRRPCDHATCRPNCPTYRNRGVAGGVWSTECPPSTKSPGSWNLHTNAILSLRSDDDRRGLRWLAPWAEISWYWRRATCLTHKRCPGSPICAGGAWDLHVEAYDPKRGIREYLKYVTKSAEILETAGPAGLIEFLLARRRVKFLSAFGSFFGVRFKVDRDEQRAADEELTRMWISDFSTRPMPKICPACGAVAQWNGEGVLAARTELRLIGGFLAWRPPPIVRAAIFAAPFVPESSFDGPALGEWLRATEPWLAPVLPAGALFDE